MKIKELNIKELQKLFKTEDLIIKGNEIIVNNNYYSVESNVSYFDEKELKSKKN